MKRNHDENYDDYKTRRKADKIDTARLSDGKLIHDSDKLGTKIGSFRKKEKTRC
jgi:hypothetical protein